MLYPSEFRRGTDICIITRTDICFEGTWCCTLSQCLKCCTFWKCWHTCNSPDSCLASQLASFQHRDHVDFEFDDWLEHQLRIINTVGSSCWKICSARSTLDGASRGNAICGANGVHDELFDSRCRLSYAMECSRLCRDIWFQVHRYTGITPSGLDIFQLVYVGPNLGNGSRVDCDWKYKFNSRFPASNLD